MNVVQRARTPAEIYDEMFVPALFQQWGPIIADAAGIGFGDSVLDVACGTGVLARAALDRVGPRGTRCISLKFRRRPRWKCPWSRRRRSAD
jgi:ubiquinone/menaquinone biosynthesis C-methylase UbiE